MSYISSTSKTLQLSSTSKTLQMFPLNIKCVEKRTTTGHVTLYFIVIIIKSYIDSGKACATSWSEGRYEKVACRESLKIVQLHSGTMTRRPEQLSIAPILVTPDSLYQT